MSSSSSLRRLFRRKLDALYGFLTHKFDTTSFHTPHVNLLICTRGPRHMYEVKLLGIVGIYSARMFHIDSICKHGLIRWNRHRRLLQLAQMVLMKYTWTRRLGQVVHKHKLHVSEQPLVAEGLQHMNHHADAFAITCCLQRSVYNDRQDFVWLCCVELWCAVLCCAQLYVLCRACCTFCNVLWCAVLCCAVVCCALLCVCVKS